MRNRAKSALVFLRQRENNDVHIEYLCRRRITIVDVWYHAEIRSDAVRLENKQKCGQCERESSKCS